MEEVGLPYEVLPVDTSKGELHLPALRKINPNGKVPAIVDTEGPGGNEARVFDSSAILLCLADKTGEFLGSPEDRPELVSWLFFIASGLGPFSGQSVHFQFAAPEGVNYARNRYRREAERRFLATEVSERAECPSWLFWQMGSAPYLGGGFGHFYAYAPTKIEYAIHQFAMEAKDQLDVLDRRLAESEYLAGGRGQTHSRGFQIECSPKIK